MAYNIADTVTGYTITPTGSLYTNVSEVVFTATVVSTILPFNAVWLFGDGTYHVSTDTTVAHRYTKPGTYTTALIAFNTIEEYRNFIISNDLSLLDLPGSESFIKFTQSIVVENFITDAVEFDAGAGYAYQGRLSDAFELTFTLSRNAIPSFTLFSEGSNSQPLQNIEPKWSHLKPHWRFQDAAGANIDTLVPAVSSLSTLLLIDNALSAVPYDPTLDSTLVVGVSGSAIFHYVDDTPGIVQLRVTLDTNSYPNPADGDHTLVIPSYANSTVATSYNYTISASTPTQLVITANGLNTFTLEGVKWQYALTPYVITICDAEGYILFNYPLDNDTGSNNPIDVSITGVSADAVVFQTDVPAFQQTDSDGFGVGGYYTGFFQVLSSVAAATLVASVSLETESGFVTLSGESDTFSVVDYGETYDIRRFNESFDMASTIKSYALQETIAQNAVLFDGLIGQIVGDADASVDALGKSIYERIANYVGNHSDIDTCNVSKLYSICESLNIPIEDFNFAYPAALKRIMDILSVSYTRLRGSRELFDRDFGRTSNISSAANLGSALDSVTYQISAGVDVVVQEKGTSNFELLHTAPIDGEDVYPVGMLSAVNFRAPVDKYYRFFEYIPGYTNTQVAGVIDWSDPATTLSESLSSINEWTGNAGTMEAILDYHLRKGLELINN